MCSIFLFFSAEGQSYRLRNYAFENGIPNGFIYSVIQDNQGYLWIGTGAGLSKFDGFDFYKINFPDLAANRFPVISLKDSNGALWFGCNDGSVFMMGNDGMKKVTDGNGRTIVSMLEGPDKFIYVFPQDESFMKINPDNPDEIKSYILDPGTMIFSACFTRTGDLLLGTQENIAICRISGDTFSLLRSVSGFDFYSVTSILRIRDTDSFLVGTNGNGVFRLSMSPAGPRVHSFADHPELQMLDVQSASQDADKNIWISTNGNGAAGISFNEAGDLITEVKVLNRNTGLAGNNAKVVYQDMEGNYWIGLFGDGLSVLNSVAFSLWSPGKSGKTNQIIHVDRIRNDYLLGTPEGYWIMNPDGDRIGVFTNLKSYVGNHEISSYCVDESSNIWFGTDGGGLYLRNQSGSTKRFYLSGNSGQDKINDVAVDKKYVWLATLNGVIILNRFTGDSIAGYNIYNGLSHNSISQLYLMSDGKAAVAMETDRLFTIDPVEGVIQGKAVMYGTTRNEIVAFCQTKDGHLFASTNGNGIFEFYSDSLRSFTRTDNLMSDYCYSILADSLNNLWIGHDRGFSVFNRYTGVIRTFGSDFTHQAVCTPDGMYESPDGKIFIGTSDGFILYDRRKDLIPSMPPVNNINFISINDSVYPIRNSYTLPYRKMYNITVGYVGINLKNPEKVYYQTILENYNDKWSESTTERSVKYTPSDGRYRFIMRSVNEFGLSSDTAVSFELLIKKPFWRSWWFILGLLSIISGAVFIIVREREKAQKKIQLYLEKELDARTSVVLKQKDKIELQNIEITDSINYAKRIQTSILPDFSRLKETFSESFLLFRPRDIVSGDFYWFDKFDDEKFILVCADSTGHGVPGAFMSMIGSTLLQDIVARQRISKPSEILKMLDKQIFTTLNQNIELGVSNDGMDMVVCEINIRKRHIRFASAMRPVILVLDGEPLYIKGNRCSVGGESVIEKYFDDQEYYLNAGDTLYLFSDGLPDQFGGTDGKKMKIARLKKLIEDVSSLPLSGQKEVITKFYDEWKGDHDQVDDILLIGVRL